MHERSSYSPIKIWAIRVSLSVALFLLSTGLCVSLLHIFIPRDEKVNIKSTPSSSQVRTKDRAVTYSEPVRIEINDIRVSAPVAAVGLTKDNDMDISPDVASAAWYKHGSKPGEVGSAVIAGHYGVKDGQRAIFSDLHLLKQGDIISVNDENGEILTFSVREVRTYDLHDDATNVFVSNDGKARLNLITCSGTWNTSLQTYSDRFVVFTELKT